MMHGYMVFDKAGEQLVPFQMCIRDSLITVGISQSGEESSWKDANTASFMDTFVKSNGYEAVYADAGSDQEKQIEDVEGFIKQGVDYIILNPISEIG